MNISKHKENSAYDYVVWAYISAQLPLMTMSDHQSNRVEPNTQDYHQNCSNYL